MAENAEVKGVQDVYAGNSEINALDFLVKQMIGATVNTAIPVIVTEVGAGGHENPAGRVTVKALVKQRDGNNLALPMADMFDLPYMRYQGGKVAVICDPVVGDIGLAVFAQQDSSNVRPGTSEPVQPGSFRAFDMADGFYIGGFLNRPPATWVELEQNGTVTIHAPQKIRLDAPTIEITGAIIAQNGITSSGAVVSSNGVVLDTHTHGGVEPGGGSTGGPN
jgi:hypothetical protein